MAMMQGGGSGGRRTRGRRALNAEINVTPFVDVVLVLLIVFMITAPLLTKGVDLTLPKSQANPLPAAQEQPLSISLTADGKLFIQQTEIEVAELIPKLEAIVGEGYEERIYFRADTDVSHGRVMDVLGRVTSAGYRNIAVVTDPRSNGAQ